VNKECTTDHKERNTIARSVRKLNEAHHGVRALVEIQILHFLLLFLIVFWILYHLNRKHTNIYLNCTEDLAYRNSTIFSMKFKAPSQLELGALEVEFGPLFVGKPDWGGFGWMQNLISPNFFKKYLNPSSYTKVMTVLSKHVRVTVLEGGI
jgi:hypothetical protein